MLGIPKQGYTDEFKQEAVKLVEGGQEPAAVAKELGISEQTLANWRKAAGVDKLAKGQGKPITPEQMELSQLRADTVQQFIPFHLRSPLQKMGGENSIPTTGDYRIPTARISGTRTGRSAAGEGAAQLTP